MFDRTYAQLPGTEKNCTSGERQAYRMQDVLARHLRTVPNSIRPNAVIFTILPLQLRTLHSQHQIVTLVS